MTYGVYLLSSEFLSAQEIFNPQLFASIIMTGGTIGLTYLILRVFDGGIEGAIWGLNACNMLSAVIMVACIVVVKRSRKSIRMVNKKAVFQD